MEGALNSLSGYLFQAATQPPAEITFKKNGAARTIHDGLPVAGSLRSLAETVGPRLVHTATLAARPMQRFATNVAINSWAISNVLLAMRANRRRPAPGHITMRNRHTNRQRQRPPRQRIVEIEGKKRKAGQENEHVARNQQPEVLAFAVPELFSIGIPAQYFFRGGGRRRFALLDGSHGATLFRFRDGSRRIWSMGNARWRRAVATPDWPTVLFVA
jgi:hypothetical protein